jgi:hypothetical protein
VKGGVEIIMKKFLAFELEVWRKQETLKKLVLLLFIPKNCESFKQGILKGDV